MTIAVLSDIHGNHVALEACIKEMARREVSEIIFLGDYLGEMAYPRKTMDLLYSLQEKYHCNFIRGNKEDYWIDHNKDRNTYSWKRVSSSTGCLQYVYDQLTPEDIHFFETKEISLELYIEEFPAITACHGSPNRNNEALSFGSKKSDEYMEQAASQIILCGHTHIQGVQQQRGKFLFNPGSVGLGYLDGSKAQMLLLSSNNWGWDYEFVNLNYDVERVFAEMQESGLWELAPSWCRVTRHFLLTGEITHTKVIKSACTFWSQADISWNWREIPEKYWQMALEEMGIA